MKELIGYCGLDCELCDARIATLNNDDELRARTAKLWCEMNNTDVIKPEHINCTGCRVEGVKTYFCSCLCEVRKCCVEKGFETCAECSEKAICEKLAPFMDNEVARKNMEEPILNSHNKAEFEPAHTAEHILNRTMVNMFGCPRSRNAHVERKKSKCDYLLAECPADDQVRAIEAKVNEVIAAALPVTIAYMSREEAASVVDLSKLPEGASDTLRIVRIGDYDDCACIGAHVSNTSEIGQFRIISHDFNDGVWRVRWKVVK